MGMGLVFIDTIDEDQHFICMHCCLLEFERKIVPICAIGDFIARERLDGVYTSRCTFEKIKNCVVVEENNGQYALCVKCTQRLGSVLAAGGYLINMLSLQLWNGVVNSDAELGLPVEEAMNIGPVPAVAGAQANGHAGGQEHQNEAAEQVVQPIIEHPIEVEEQEGVADEAGAQVQAVNQDIEIDELPDDYQLPDGYEAPQPVIQGPN